MEEASRSLRWGAASALLPGKPSCRARAGGSCWARQLNEHVMLEEASAHFAHRDGDPQSARAPGRALEPVLLSQMCGGKKWLFFYLLVRSHMALLTASLWVDLVIAWVCFPKHLGSCGLWEGLGAWGRIYFVVHMKFRKGNKAGKQDAQGLADALALVSYVSQALQWPWQVSVLCWLTDSPNCCCGQMIYSYRDLGRWLQHRLFALNCGGGNGQHWGIW